MSYENAYNHGIAGYHLPTEAEWAGVLPTGTTNETSLNMKPRSVSSSAPGTQARGELVVQQLNNSATVGIQIKNVPEEKTSYAIHLIEDATGNKRRVAYRLLPNPEFQQYKNTMVKITYVEMNGRVRYPTTADAVGAVAPVVYFDPIEDDTDLEIQAIYLDPHFLGTIEDIANAAWWENADRSQDVVIRRISARGNEYPYFVYLENTFYRTRKYAAVRFGMGPQAMHYWLQSPSTQRAWATYPKTKIEYGVHETHRMYFFSSFSLYSDVKDRPWIVGGFVRLFSDN